MKIKKGKLGEIFGLPVFAEAGTVSNIPELETKLDKDAIAEAMDKMKKIGDSPIGVVISDQAPDGMIYLLSGGIAKIATSPNNPIGDPVIWDNWKAEEIQKNQNHYFCPKCGWEPPEIHDIGDIEVFKSNFGLELSEPNPYTDLSEFENASTLIVFGRDGETKSNLVVRWTESWRCPHDLTRFSYQNSL